MLKAIGILLLSTTFAFAQSGPPAGFFGNAPNTGGTLILTWCTAAGWPCRDAEQQVWGQICYATFAQGNAEEQLKEYADGTSSVNPEGRVIWPFTKYAGWKCPGTQFDEAAKKIGYGDGGPPLPANWRELEDQKATQWSCDAFKITDPAECQAKFGHIGQDMEKELSNEQPNR